MEGGRGRAPAAPWSWYTVPKRRAAAPSPHGNLGQAIKFSQPVSLAANEMKLVRFAPADFKELTLQKPRIWWPYRMGKPELYTL